MKTNDLHNTLAALDIEPVQTPEHQAVLRSALLRYVPRKQTFVHRLQVAAKNFIGVPMRHKKLFVTASSLALITVLAIGITTYNYGHSPRAEAEQLINQSLGFMHTVSSDQFSKIQSQLGGDPVEELETAKAAKDLTVLTPEEFKVESSKHQGMAMSSLGKDGPQFNSIGISANGNLPTTPPGGEGQGFATGGAVEAQPGEAGVSYGMVRVSSGEAPMSNPNEGPESKKVVEYHSSASAAIAGGSPAQPLPAPVTPTKYLRYTNDTGHVVVLGLDDNGTPVSKTIFMTDEEVKNMQSGGPGPIRLGQ